MAKATFLLLDTTSNFIFSQILGGELDFTKISNKFRPKEELDHFFPWYCVQLKDGMDESKHRGFTYKLQQLGWNVDNGINGTPVKHSYGGAIEAMSLCIRAILMLSEWYTRLDETGEDHYELELVLFANHLSYSKLLKEVKLNFSDTRIKLVCDTQSADDALLQYADDIVDIRKLDLTFDRGGR